MSESEIWIFKLLLLGDTAVGKTSLINKYVQDKFKEDYRGTMGVNIILKNIKLKKIQSKARLIIWDIAGQERYEKTRQTYFEGCSGALFVYDITRFSSYENIELKWFKDYKKHTERESSYILIGNKSDLEDQRGVFKKDGINLAKKINAIDFIETSAKEGTNVEDAFLKLVYHILIRYGVKT